MLELVEEETNKYFDNIDKQKVNALGTFLIQVIYLLIILQKYYLKVLIKFDPLLTKLRQFLTLFTLKLVYDNILMYRLIFTQGIILVYFFIIFLDKKEWSIFINKKGLFINLKEIFTK